MTDTEERKESIWQRFQQWEPIVSLRSTLAEGLPPGLMTTAMSVRPPTPNEASGRKTLLRAGIISIIGGCLIAIVSAAFGVRMFAADVRVWGMFVGLSIAALGALSIPLSQQRKYVQGAFILVLSIVSFPIAMGGYVLGALAGIVGGAMLIGYEPPTGPVRIETRPAHLVRRLVALVVDFTLAFGLQRLLFALFPPLFSSTFNVIVSWVFVWAVIALEPVILSRRTAGRLLMSLRIADWETGERPSNTAALKRELYRGTYVIVTLFVVWTAIFQASFSPVRGVINFIVMFILGLALDLYHAAGRFSHTIDVHDVIVADDFPRSEPHRADGSPETTAVELGQADGSPATTEVESTQTDGSPVTAGVEPAQADGSPVTAGVEPAQADGSPATAGDEPARSEVANSHALSSSPTGGDGPELATVGTDPERTATVSALPDGVPADRRK